MAHFAANFSARPPSMGKEGVKRKHILLVLRPFFFLYWWVIERTLIIIIKEHNILPTCTEKDFFLFRPRAAHGIAAHDEGHYRYFMGVYPDDLLISTLFNVLI